MRTLPVCTAALLNLSLMTANLVEPAQAQSSGRPVGAGVRTPPAQAGVGRDAPEPDHAPPGPWTRVHVTDPARRSIVHRALNTTFDLLGEPNCQAVLDDFPGQEGRSLREPLAALELDMRLSGHGGVHRG
jgi:hypothetical protein